MSNHQGGGSPTTVGSPSSPTNRDTGSSSTNNTYRTALTTASSSFAFLEYYLQISLHATTARISAAWALSNPHLTLDFEARCKDLLVLDAWIDEADMGRVNEVEDDVMKRGFVLLNHHSASASASGGGSGNNGEAGAGNGTGYLKVRVGSLFHYHSHETKKIVKKLWLCKVGIGRAYYADEEYARIGTLPANYDSFYVGGSGGSNTAPSSEQSGNKPTAGHNGHRGGADDSYSHEYIIKESSQILPLYQVVFEYDPELERKSREKNMCDNCEKQLATVYCTADNAYLCSNCDGSLHSNKLTSRHVRNPVGQGTESFGKCRQHPDKVVEFFCPTCHVPVCVYCKMVGHHSSGESSRHKLVSVSEAYTTVLESSCTPDPILLARKQAIENQLNAINTRARLVEKNSTEVKAVIEDLYRRALSELKLITRKKLTILKGDECELYRQLGEMKRLESFLAYQQEGGDRTQFLLNWGRHLQLRAELHAFRFFRDEIDVYPDIKCGGSIHVHVDGSMTGSSLANSLNNNANSNANNLNGSNGPSSGLSNGGVNNASANLLKALPHSSTLASNLMVGGAGTTKKNHVYDAITMGKGPRIPVSGGGRKGSANAMESGVPAGSVKVRRTSDFFAETLHALDLGSESMSVADTESEI